MNGYPQPNAAQLRMGLHALVVALAAVVLLRAVLLGHGAALVISLLVAAFVVVYIARTRAVARVQRLSLGFLLCLWVGLELLGADAAYMSLGLFLVFLTELPLWPAVVGVTTMTTFDVAVGATREDTAEMLLAPLMGAGLSLLLGVGYRVLFDATTSQRELIDELQRTRAELAAFEHAAGQARERQRLAGEIHDTVAQGLSSIQLLLHAVETEERPEQASDRLAMARDTAASSLVEVRRIVAELAPADLADGSLDAALLRVCSRAIVDARFLKDGEPVSVPMPVEAALIRITQSALANVEQHAGPEATAVVTLSWSGERVRLDVVDDGCGFDTTAVAGSSVPSFGLDTIRTRVSELGGDFTLESEPGHTALAVSFPLAPVEQA